MSYILDALKKSEQERGHGGIPDVQTIHSSSLNYRNDKKSLWPYILIVAVIFNLLAIIYFNYDANPDIVTTENESSDKQLKTIATETTLLETHLKETPQTVAASEKPSASNTPINNNKEENAEIRSAVTEKAVSTKKPAVTETKMSSTASLNNSNKKTAGQVTEMTSDIIEYYDLPASISKQLPAIIISAHVYSSNPMQRSIVINNKLLEEGDYVIDDLIIYEITADGAIFTYNDIMFHHGVVAGWQ